LSKTGQDHSSQASTNGAVSSESSQVNWENAVEPFFECRSSRCDTIPNGM